MARAGADLVSDVFEHDFTLDHAELAVIDRDDGTVPAQMLAASGGLGVRDRLRFFADAQKRVIFERRQSDAIGREKFLAVDRYLWRER